MGSKIPAPATQMSAIAEGPKALVTAEGRALRSDQDETSHFVKAAELLELSTRDWASGVSLRSAMRTLALDSVLGGFSDGSLGFFRA